MKGIAINKNSKVSLVVRPSFSLLSCDGGENISTSSFIEMNKLYSCDNSQEKLSTYELDPKSYVMADLICFGTD